MLDQADADKTYLAVTRRGVGVERPTIEKTVGVAKDETMLAEIQ